MNDARSPEPAVDEEPLIGRLLSEAPAKRVLVLGCGSGRQTRRLSKLGFAVVAIDASKTALEQAKAEPLPENVEFLLGDIGAVEKMVTGHFGAAFCLGNTLPCLLSAESVSRMFVGLKRRLLPGAPFLLQLLNYDRIFAGAERVLPAEVLPAPDGEHVVVQLVEPRTDGIVVHCTSKLLFRPTLDPAMELVDTQLTQLRGWRQTELEILLEVSSWSIRGLHGDLDGSPYSPDDSRELVIVAG